MIAQPETASERTRPIDIALTVARAVTALSDVVALDGGAVEEVATYGDGRRVAGVRLRAGRRARIAVHVVLRYGRPLPEIISSVRALARAAAADVDPGLADAAIDIYITDLEVEDTPS